MLCQEIGIWWKATKNALEYGKGWGFEVEVDVGLSKWQCHQYINSRFFLIFPASSCHVALI